MTELEEQGTKHEGGLIAQRALEDLIIERIRSLPQAPLTLLHPSPHL